LTKVVEAFDVLTDESLRAVYDKCRDYRVRAAGKKNRV
jgi:curved DNA-binding protein CbpA